MTRIIGGQAGSLRLVVPKASTRPTSDRVREAWFSRIEAHRSLSGSSVLDLFAGSGALGLEAASRGATSVTLVDNNPQAVTAMRDNQRTVSRACTPAPSIRVVKSSALSFVQQAGSSTWDLVFLDPPYDYTSSSLNTLLEALVPVVAAEGWVLLERSARSEPPQWPEGFSALPSKTYGDTVVYVAEKS